MVVYIFTDKGIYFTSFLALYFSPFFAFLAVLAKSNFVSYNSNNLIRSSPRLAVWYNLKLLQNLDIILYQKIYSTHYMVFFLHLRQFFASDSLRPCIEESAIQLFYISMIYGFHYFCIFDTHLLFPAGYGKIRIIGVLYSVSTYQVYK